MICSERPVVVFLAAAALVTIWSFRLVLFPDVSLSGLLFEGDNTQKYANETVFIQEAMEVEFPTPIDYKPIKEMCEKSNFRPGVLFTCEGQHGGIGMVRNQILKCVRYAIHGGGALVVPTISLRSPKDLAEIIGGKEVSLDYLLNREAFIKHLTSGCPGMKLYERAEDFPGYKDSTALNLTGDQFDPEHPKTGIRHINEWRGNFDEFLAQQRQLKQIQPDVPIHVQMQQSYLEYPVHDDGDAFAGEFGKILSFRNDTREIAAKVLWELRQQMALKTIDPSRAISPSAFYGAHLRLEQDALWAWSPDEGWKFSRQDDQFNEQAQYIARTGLKVVYVASGNDTVVDLFAKHLRVKNKLNVTVVTKHDLLKPGTDVRTRLDSMTFDQQGLVDFLVMFKATAFMGVAHSSFSWNVALRRHELSRYHEVANEGSDLLRDEYSVIMGMEKDYPYIDPFVYAIWP